MIRIQDKWNEHKVWIINVLDFNKFEWNQEIDGNLFYNKFTPVCRDNVREVLGIELPSSKYRGETFYVNEDLYVVVCVDSDGKYIAENTDSKKADKILVSEEEINNYIEVGYKPSSGFLFNNVSEMREAIKKEYRRAVEEAKKVTGYNCTRSNPLLLAMNAKGERMDEDVYYSGQVTKKLVLELANRPDVVEVWYDSGIDAAASPKAFEYDEYEPKVWYAEVLLYKK